MIAATLLIIIIIQCCAYSVVLSSLDIYSKAFRGPSPPVLDKIMVEHSCNIVRSYFELCGRNILEDSGIQDPIILTNSNPKAVASALYSLPNDIVLSHGIQDGTDGPILNYGNSAALRRWKCSWSELTITPSRDTAEPMLQQAREEFMQTVTAQGYVDDYSGIRVGFDGSRFRILDTCVWNIIVDGKMLGQAAHIKSTVDVD